MEDFSPPPASAFGLPVADVRAATGTAESVFYQAFPVRQSEADLDDFFVRVRASTLRRSHARLKKIGKGRFPWHEVTLGASTLALGAFLGALPANLKAGSVEAVLFYTLMPVLGVASGVAFFFLRQIPSSEATLEANEILADLPDPDKAR